jgi:hypothetical protein
MMLEARSPSCWSDHYVLKLDGRPWGEYRGRWFSEGVDIHFLAEAAIAADQHPPRGGVDAKAGTEPGRNDVAVGHGHSAPPNY